MVRTISMLVKAFLIAAFLFTCGCAAVPEKTAFPVKNELVEIEEDLWKKIVGVINLEYGMLNHAKVQRIFEEKLDLIKQEGNAYNYLGRLPSGDYFTVLIREQNNGDGSYFIFQWSNKIDSKHDYIDVTTTPSPKNLCIKALDRKADIQASDSVARINHYFNNRSMTYLAFHKAQVNQWLDTKIYLDEEYDCLLRVEMQSSLVSLPIQPMYSK